MPDPKKSLIAVNPRWWHQTVQQVAQLASDSSRVAALASSIEADQIDPAALPVLLSLLARFRDTAESISAEFTSLLDGSSTYIVSADPGDPGRDPIDLLALAKGYQFGHVYGGKVVEERLWEYGDGPDALPKAFEALAKQLRALPPADRKAANVFMLLDRDAEPTGATPAG